MAWGIGESVTKVICFSGSDGRNIGKSLGMSFSHRCFNV
jgi:hypothetical protein